jgi:transcriptional regulator with XRE-family HTH domain
VIFGNSPVLLTLDKDMTKSYTVYSKLLLHGELKMNLAEKIKHLREIEGELRGLNRAMTQMEVVKAMQEELGESISQAYMSQLESSKRLHLTASSRSLLARFFKVHPGYLVSDPPDYSTDLLADMGQDTDRLKTWLIANTVEWRSDPALHDLLASLVQSNDPHRYLQSFRNLMQLSVEELEAIVDALTETKELDKATPN